MDVLAIGLNELKDSEKLESNDDNFDELDKGLELCLSKLSELGLLEENEDGLSLMFNVMRCGNTFQGNSDK